MFKDFKDRFTERLRNLPIAQDDLDKEIGAIVDAGTLESLQSPDWGKNLALVDIVNQNPEVCIPKLLRVIGRVFAKPVVRTQVLALTMLDTCMRNCHPWLHLQLAQSLLWADLLKLVQDTSVHRIDLEVRDKILVMIEDYGRYLKNPPSFAEVYENLVDQGVDFPVRSNDEMVPIEVMDVPLRQPLAAQDTSNPLSPGSGSGSGASGLFANLFGPAAGPLATGAGAVAGAVTGGLAGPIVGAVTGSMAGSGAGAGRGQGPPPARAQRGRSGQRGGGVDPSVLEGLSEEDRAAVQAAMQEMAGEMESAQERAAIAASLAGEPLEAIPPLPTSTPNTPGTNPAPPNLLGATPAAGRPPGPPPLPESNEEALQVISNSVGLFQDMLSGVSDEEPAGVRDPLIRDLADQCALFRSRLTHMAQEVTDEALLVAALTQNDALGTAMARYDALMAQALAQGPIPVTSPAEDTAARVAAAATAISQGGLPAGAGPNFTLLDEDEDEDQPAQDLTTRRNQAPDSSFSSHPGAATVPPVQPAAAAPAAPAVPSAYPPVPVADMLGEEDLEQPASPPTAVAAATAPEASNAPAPVPAAKDDPLI